MSFVKIIFLKDNNFSSWRTYLFLESELLIFSIQYKKVRCFEGTCWFTIEINFTVPIQYESSLVDHLYIFKNKNYCLNSWVVIVFDSLLSDF